jgi:hypothetical protein
MRISDLIHFVRLSTAQNTDVPTSRDAWLVVSRQAFPRPDLLSWFDGVPKAPPDPIVYFPALVVASTFIMASSAVVRRVLTIEGRTPIAGPIAGLFGGPAYHIDIDIKTGILELPTALPLHEVALTVGVFDQAGDRQAAALKLLWEANYYSSAKLFFFSGEVFKAWNGGTLPPPDESDVYRGLLQRHGDSDWFVIYRDVAARRASRPG